MNLRRTNEVWEKKLREERKRWDLMRTLKLQKGMEGEESLLLTESFPNILEQELKIQLASLQDEINENTVQS
jgi:hypothetical protein